MNMWLGGGHAEFTRVMKAAIDKSKTEGVENLSDEEMASATVAFYLLYAPTLRDSSAHPTIPIQHVMVGLGFAIEDGCDAHAARNLIRKIRQMDSAGLQMHRGYEYTYTEDSPQVNWI